jgi:hypothetical protein
LYIIKPRKIRIYTHEVPSAHSFPPSLCSIPGYLQLESRVYLHCDSLMPL